MQALGLTSTVKHHKKNQKPESPRSEDPKGPKIRTFPELLSGKVGFLDFWIFGFMLFCGRYKRRSTHSGPNKCKEKQISARLSYKHKQVQNSKEQHNKVQKGNKKPERNVTHAKQSTSKCKQILKHK